MLVGHLSVIVLKDIFNTAEGIAMKQAHCILVGSTVTALCDGVMDSNPRNCNLAYNSSYKKNGDYDLLHEESNNESLSH
ncbi:hypothetical protein KIN20_003229 [Parelaphostrongylus tenuis]|uniref:Uncharacterized protein n=1 Tax=Parelaphostrongylus tenuis TaxID=148309 RepID=A0AAD5MI13_PARTN|nr:hypothetical protein KIN20_003229 [Parelaphostrongylus tenuis]